MNNLENEIIIKLFSYDIITVFIPQTSNNMTEYILVFKNLGYLLYQTANTNEIESIEVINETWLGLSKSGQLFTIPQSPEVSPIQITLKTQVIFISSNSSCCLLLSAEGQVYSLGLDLQNYGVLGHYNTESKAPFLISSLRNIEQISLGKTHAGALSISSAFYLWGETTSMSTCEPAVQSFDLFTIQHFECGDNYSLITTTGGYLYIIGSLGHSHKTPKRLGPCGVFAPPNMDKICVTGSAAGYKFVVFLNENHEAFVFDGCLEIVKLPMQSYQKIEKLHIIGQRILGICIDTNLIEWVLDRGFESTECNLYDFTGLSYKKPQNFKLIGKGQNKFFALSPSHNPLQDNPETIPPYKRTEFGKKLISKVRESVRISGNLDFMRSSIDNSPVFKPPKNDDLSKCEKLVYSINFVFKKFFSDLKVFVYREKTCKAFRSRGIFGMFYRNYEKFLHVLAAKGFDRLKINVQVSRFRERCAREGAVGIFQVLKRVLMFTGVEGLVFRRKVSVLERVFHIVHAKAVNREKMFFRTVKVDLRLWKLKKVLAPKLKLSFAHGFLPVKQEYKQEKSCKSLIKSLKKLVYQSLNSHFASLQSYTNLIRMHKSIYTLHLSTHISALFFRLSLLKTSNLKFVFNLLKTLLALSHLTQVLFPRLHKSIASLVPHQISCTFLQLQSSLIQMVLRQQHQVIKSLLQNSFLENSIEHEIDMLSPIKAFNTKEDDSEIKCSTLSFPVGGNLSHNRNNSGQLNDFQKYMLWYKEFKCKHKEKRMKKKEKNEKPPWRPAGVTVKKNKAEDEVCKKNVKRRREYSESIRSSKCSVSSEESFCRRIGWDKNAYLRKFRDRKKREIMKLVAMSSFRWVLYKRIRKVWRGIKRFGREGWGGKNY